MAKHGSQNWRKVDSGLWRKFKARCAKLGIKIYDAQTEMIEWFLKTKKGGTNESKRMVPESDAVLEK